MSELSIYDCLNFQSYCYICKSKLRFLDYENLSLLIESLNLNTKVNTFNNKIKEKFYEIISENLLSDDIYYLELRCPCSRYYYSFTISFFHSKESLTYIANLYDSLLIDKFLIENDFSSKLLSIEEKKYPNVYPLNILKFNFNINFYDKTPEQLLKKINTILVFQ